MRLPRTRARARDDVITETRSRSPKRRTLNVWATQSRTLVIVNTFVVTIIACNFLALVWTRWSERDALRVERKRLVTHAGYVERRTVSSAGAAARALYAANDGDIGAEVPVPPPLRVDGNSKSTSEVQPPTPRKKPPVKQVYAIAQRGCRAQWEEFADRARLYGWPAVRWDVAKTRTIRLAAPPLPLDPALASLARHAHGRGTRGILRRKIAYLDAHRRAWAAVARTRAAHALISDIHLFPSAHTTGKLAAWILEADNAAITKHAQWHVMLLRPVDIVHKRRRKVAFWADGIRRAGSANGASAYIVSQAGARLLLANVRAYRGSIDAEFARLAREMDGAFVVLTPCEEAAGVCDTLTEDITVERVVGKVPCVWRALEERHLAQHILKHNKF